MMRWISKCNGWFVLLKLWSARRRGWMATKRVNPSTTRTKNVTPSNRLIKNWQSYEMFGSDQSFIHFVMRRLQRERERENDQRAYQTNHVTFHHPLLNKYTLSERERERQSGQTCIHMNMCVSVCNM